MLTKKLGFNEPPLTERFQGIFPQSEFSRCALRSPGGWTATGTGDTESTLTSFLIMYSTFQVSLLVWRERTETEDFV